MVSYGSVRKKSEPECRRSSRAARPVVTRAPGAARLDRLPHDAEAARLVVAQRVGPVELARLQEHAPADAELARPLGHARQEPAADPATAERLEQAEEGDLDRAVVVRGRAPRIPRACRGRGRATVSTRSAHACQRPAVQPRRSIQSKSRPTST
jgi:hypothetical protein